jgi:hypothetical protein
MVTNSSFKPPEGVNFGCEGLVPIASLSIDLRRIVAFLQDKYPYAVLKRFEDWWQHDGLHFEKGRLDWHGLFEIVGSAKAIYESMQGDDYVRVGVAATDGNWYLRFYAWWDDEGEFPKGDYDITLPAGLAEEFRGVIPSLKASIREEASKEYFGRLGILRRGAGK